MTCMSQKLNDLCLFTFVSHTLEIWLGLNEANREQSSSMCLVNSKNKEVQPSSRLLSMNRVNKPFEIVANTLINMS